jgi:N-acetylneuraminate synthase
MSETIAIAGRTIGPGHPPYMIAELSANHLGQLDRALAIMDAAKQAGADAVKLQTYTADTITLDHDGPGFTIEGGLWHGRRLHDLYREAHTPWDWHESLFAHGRQLGISVFSSPFDPTAIEFLESLGAPAYKIASFEIVDLPLVERAAATAKPLVISTGMANLSEIGEALAAARGAGNGGIVLLHCVSGYPTPPGDSNLRRLITLAERFDVLVGLSDHTLGTTTAVAATALGAVAIEKHITLRRDDGGPDSAFSLEPKEFETLVGECHTAFAALGSGRDMRAASEEGNVKYRRSLYVVADMRAGERFTESNVRSIRPGLGLAPKHLKAVIGKTATRAIPRGTPLAWDLVESSA